MHRVTGTLSHPSGTIEAAVPQVATLTNNFHTLAPPLTCALSNALTPVETHGLDMVVLTVGNNVTVTQCQPRVRGEIWLLVKSNAVSAHGDYGTHVQRITNIYSLFVVST